MTIIAENDIGFLVFDGNELTIGSKIDDPPKLRLTSPLTDHGGGGGVVSFNLSRRAGVVLDGHDQDEIGMVRVEQAEDVRGQLGNHKAEANLLLADGSGVGDVVKPIAVVWNAVTRLLPAFGAALRTAVLEGGTVPAPTLAVGDYDGAQFIGSQGLFLYARQTDGHDVVYRRSDMHPLWMSDGGPNGTWLG